MILFRKMCHDHPDKWEKNNGKNRTVIPRKLENTQRKGK